MDKILQILFIFSPEEFSYNALPLAVEFFS